MKTSLIKIGEKLKQLLISLEEMTLAKAMECARIIFRKLLELIDALIWQYRPRDLNVKISDNDSSIMFCETSLTQNRQFRNCNFTDCPVAKVLPDKIYLVMAGWGRRSRGISDARNESDMEGSCHG